MRQARKSRNALFDWAKPRVYSATTKKYHKSHSEAASERRKVHKEAADEKRRERIELLARRKEHLEDLRFAAERKRLERQIAQADKKVDSAEAKIEKAEERASKGAISEGQLSRIKTHMEKEIEKQEQFKSRARSNPCFQSRKAGNVTDRAKRYRANQRGCKPAGQKKCKICGSKRSVVIDHKDGNEANSASSNLRYLCKSCNTMLGAAMAKTGEGRRTVQYNPAGAQTLGEYVNAVLQHERHWVPGRGWVGAHDAGGAIIHATPKYKRDEYASEIWAIRKSHGNPARSGTQYRLAQAVLSGTARESHISPEAAREIVDRTPAKLRSEYSRNPALEFSTEYHLGYNLGQVDRQTASMRKTPGELHATFAANFGSSPSASWESFEQAYQAGYGGQIGAASPNPTSGDDIFIEKRHPSDPTIMVRPSTRKAGMWTVWVGGFERMTKPTKKGAIGYGERILRNPEPAGDGSEEYRQASRIAALFHGRPVQQEVTVKDSVREHDWYVEIGPLVSLKVRSLTKRNAVYPFHMEGDALVHLFASPDGKQFYFRGGDQELDLNPIGMGPKSAWWRDFVEIGECKEITYQDRKKFHRFKLTEYYHKLGEVTKKKPKLVYDTLSQKILFVGGQSRIETNELVDGMSPGIVN